MKLTLTLPFFFHRKTHQMELKEDVDRFIYINRNALELDHSKFHSTDSICKYCGMDFRFFRALKNHLQSHITSKQKPYQCMLCQMGFCSKPVCVRHIHKSHPDVSELHSDGFIRVVFDVDSRENDSTNLDEGVPLYSIDTPAFSPFDHRSENGTAQPPAAHSTPKPNSMVGRSSRHVSPPSSHVSPQSSHSPGQLVIKTEPEDVNGESPLDFSKKAAGILGFSGNIGKSGSEETPMDLSFRKSSTTPEQHLSAMVRFYQNIIYQPR